MEAHSGPFKILFLLTCLIAASFLTPAQAQKAGAKDDIHSVNFRNFTYDVIGFCEREFGKKQIRVRNGVFGSFSNCGFSVGNVVYGDLTGDGRDEAVVMTSCGGMHPEDEPYVYTMKDGNAFLLTRLESGNRAFGGYQKIDIKNGLLITERLQGRAACCPEYVEKKTYKWNGKAFIEVGKAERKKYE